MFRRIQNLIVLSITLLLSFVLLQHSVSAQSRSELREAVWKNRQKLKVWQAE